MENIGKLLEAGKLKEAADLLPAPNEMENDYGTIEQKSIPVETVFYSIRQDGNCVFERKSRFRKNGQERHKLFFFCKNINLCINATVADDTLPVWEVSTKKQLKIIRIKPLRIEFLLPFYNDFLDVHYYDLEKILYYYLIKHKLDGYEAIAGMDQTLSGEDMPEFAFLENVVEQKLVIQGCLPVGEFLRQERNRKRKRRRKQEKERKKKKRNLKF